MSSYSSEKTQGITSSENSKTNAIVLKKSVNYKNTELGQLVQASPKAILEKLEPLEQSLRLFSWQKNLADITVHLGEGSQEPYEGLGNSWHYHPEFELNLMLEGEGMLFVGDHIGHFQAPDAILLGANLPHYWKARGHVKGVAIQFLDTSFLKYAPEFSELNPLLEASQYGLRLEDKSLSKSIDCLKRLKEQTALGRIAAFLQLFVQLQIKLPESSSLSTKAIGLASDKEKPMGLVIDYVLQNFEHPINLQDALALSGLSRASFHRQFKKTTGATFSHYVNNVRLQEAKRLVLESSEPITTIAFGTGFRNLSHFNAVFKKQFGCSPKKLKAQVSLD